MAKYLPLKFQLIIENSFGSNCGMQMKRKLHYLLSQVYWELYNILFMWNENGKNDGKLYVDK